MNNISPRQSIFIVFLSLFTILAAIELAQSKPVAGWDDIEETSLHGANYHTIQDVESQIEEDVSNDHNQCVSKDEYKRVVKRMYFFNSLYLISAGLSLGGLAYMYISFSGERYSCPH